MSDELLSKFSGATDDEGQFEEWTTFETISKASLILLRGFIVMGILGRFGGKETSDDPSVPKVNHPKFTSRKELISALISAFGIYVTKKLDGKPVLRPGLDNTGWLDPAFREKLCLVVTKNNHCVI